VNDAIASITNISKCVGIGAMIQARTEFKVGSKGRQKRAVIHCGDTS
jgi:hypothetical protein